MKKDSLQPSLIVFSSLFPNATSPMAGVFIKERMFRVAAHLPMAVVAPQPWSPIDFLIRIFRKSFRPEGPRFEMFDGIEVYRPRFFSVPGILKWIDGYSMAYFARPVLKKLMATIQPTIIDAHFLYPDGFAASLLAERFSLDLTTTIRGSKDEWLIGTSLEKYLKRALNSSSRVISVSQALNDAVAKRLGQPPAKCSVIGNGVDLDKFQPVDKNEARSKLGLTGLGPVLISVGGLVERKGFHRVIPLLPALKLKYPNLRFLIVGGGATQQDMFSKLQQLAKEHQVEDTVVFCGPQQPANLKWYYGAADVFTLATSHEGWANVFLEAMACGLPVITTKVGGNSEVVCNEMLGRVVDYFDSRAFEEALSFALSHSWQRQEIINYAMSNTWDKRVSALLELFKSVQTIGKS